MKLARKVVLMVILLVVFIGTSGYSFSQKIGVVTMNVQGTAGDWKHRLYWIAAELASLSPDIIVFQEVVKSSDFDQMAYLWDALNRNGWYGHGYAQYTHEGWGGGEYVYILSKKSPQAKKRGMLSNNGFGRGYAALMVDGIWFVGTHLDLNDYWRERQVGDLLGIFGNKGTMIAGDFNDNRSSYPLRWLRYNGYWMMFPENYSIDGVCISGDIGALFRYNKTEKKVFGLSDHNATLVNIWN